MEIKIHIKDGELVESHVEGTPLEVMRTCLHAKRGRTAIPAGDGRASGDGCD